MKYNTVLIPVSVNMLFPTVYMFMGGSGQCQTQMGAESCLV